MAKLTTSQIVYSALVWAEESMREMVNGLSTDDPHRAELVDELQQLCAYRRRRFGKERNPFEGCRLVGIDELRKMSVDGQSRLQEDDR